MMRFLNIGFAALFLFGAFVQLNDPDPFAWVAIYVAAAVVCVLAIRSPKLHYPAIIVAAAAILWAGFLAPHVFGSTRFGDMFGAWSMSDINVEYSREMYGLLVIALWMVILGIRAFRLRVSAISDVVT